MSMEEEATVSPADRASDPTSSSNLHFQQGQDWSWSHDGIAFLTLVHLDSTDQSSEAMTWRSSLMKVDASSKYTDRKVIDLI